jgi:hypothetical protein
LETGGSDDNGVNNGVDKKRRRREVPSSRPLTSTSPLTLTRSDAGGRSDIDREQQGDVATREVEEHNKYFAELYARVFSALAADERLAADEKSKGFWAPNANEKSGKHTMPSTYVKTTNNKVACFVA